MAATAVTPVIALAAEERLPKPKVDVAESQFATGAVQGDLPTIEGSVEYTDTHLVIKVPLGEMHYAKSRPTSKASRREFVVRGDAGREGIPGAIMLTNGQLLSVVFGNPNLNLFFSRVKA